MRLRNQTKGVRPICRPLPNLLVFVTTSLVERDMEISER